MITGIVCTDVSGGIGKDGDIPWSSKEDKTFFSHVTKSTLIYDRSLLIMGVKTWNCIPLLPDRDFVVITSGKSEVVKKINKDGEEINPETFTTIDEAIKKHNKRNIFIIGGKRIYEEGVKYCDVFYISRLKVDYHCDVKIEMDMSSFKMREFEVNEELTVCEYVRNERIVCEEHVYLSLFEELIKSNKRQTRNAVTRSLFGKHLTFDLSKGFPLLTTKEMYFKGIVEELLFMLRGETDTNKLSKKGIKIWEGNTSKEFLESRGLNYPEGDMGPMYGYQLRNYGKDYGMSTESKGIDQLKDLLDKLKKSPNDRRLIMTTLNIEQVEEGVLWPCHGLIIQFYVDDNKLSCSMYQRSADYFLGSPFNIASYAALLHIICSTLRTAGVDYTPDKLHIFIGDLHIYEDHIVQCLAQYFREPFAFPMLNVKNDHENIEDYTFDDFELVNYNCYPKIYAKMIA